MSSPPSFSSASASPLSTAVRHGADRLDAVLAEKEYLASRLHPRLRDRDYLILSDVLAVVTRFAEQVHGRLFDYGSGGAPYQSLFKRCPDYVRADISLGPKVDRLIRADGLTDEPPESYEVILSTQVLEHVAEPATYINECRRLLRPGGELLITTHGMFEEHGCPYDFTRWTSNGLERLVRQCGLEIVESSKLTTQARGALQLENCFVETLRGAPNAWTQWPWAVVRKLHRWFLTPMFNLCGRSLGHLGVVPAGDSAWIYVGISVWARKP